MHKMDSMRTLTIITTILILLTALILVNLFVNTASTTEVYRSGVYEAMTGGIVGTAEHQLERYDTAMQVTALNPSVRSNLFRQDVSIAEMATLSTEMNKTINSTTYLLTDQEYLERHVFFSDLPTDGRYFVASGSMREQPWYEEFMYKGESEYSTFLYDQINNEYLFFLLKTINNYNTADYGLYSRTDCYEAMWIKTKGFFENDNSTQNEINGYPFLFSVEQDGLLVYSANANLEDEACEQYNRYCERTDDKHMWTAGSNMWVAAEQIAGMNAVVIILYEEMSMMHFFSGIGTYLLVIVLMILLAFTLLLLVVFYRNFKGRIRFVVGLLDHFDENTSLMQYEKERRSDEIGKIKRHTIQMQNRIRTLIEEEYKMKIQNITAQYEALSANINPHFLYNTLNSIAVTAQMEGAQDSREMILALSDMFRYSSDLSRSSVKLSDELKNVQDYLYIQGIRYNKNFVYRVSVPRELLDCNVPKLILQPVVENCFKHGFRENPPDGRPHEILISAVREDRFVKLYVLDNGMGMNQEKLDRVNDKLMRENSLEPSRDVEESGAVGIINVHKRLKLFYSRECGLSLSTDEASFTCVKLLLLYNKEINE